MNRMLRTTVGVLVTLALTSAVSAQQQLPSVVQLPSFEFFSYSGSVLVPDGGTAFLGGNKTSSSASRRRGLSRGSGRVQGNAQASISATIIDLDEIDRKLLGGSKEEFLRSQRGKVTAQNERRWNPTEEGKALVRYARKQYREGDQAASFDTYRMAIDRLDGRLRELAKVEFRRVFGAAADQSLKMASRRR